MTKIKYIPPRSEAITLNLGQPLLDASPHLGTMYSGNVDDSEKTSRHDWYDEADDGGYWED